MRVKEELTLEHLAPYLPYGFLYGIYKDKKVIIRGLSFNNDYIRIDESLNPYNKVTTECFYEEIKPLLRPLSDLTKEVEHNGSKFVPAKLMWSIPAGDEYDFDTFGHIPNYWKSCIHQAKEDIRRLDYGDVKTMLKYHFDVFGLIDKGLAIAIK